MLVPAARKRNTLTVVSAHYVEGAELRSKALPLLNGQLLSSKQT
jgi:hypothetical protein